MNRWDRLDYAKAQTKQPWYNFNAWMYHNEYTFHVHAWKVLGKYLDDGGGTLFELAYRAQDATVTANKPFQDFEDSPNWKGVLRIIAYFLEGLFGF